VEGELQIWLEEDGGGGTRWCGIETSPNGKHNAEVKVGNALVSWV